MFPNAVCGPRAEGTNAEALGDRAARQGASEVAYLKLGCEKAKTSLSEPSMKRLWSSASTRYIGAPQGWWKVELNLPFPLEKIFSFSGAVRASGREKPFDRKRAGRGGRSVKCC